jgi:uncharacterized membrane protein
MSNTIYATFIDPSHAERATGALLDHGVLNQDISIVSSHTAIPISGVVSGVSDWRTENKAPSVYDSEGNPSFAKDGDNDFKNTLDAGAGYVSSAGNRVAEFGDHAAAGIAGAVGNDSAAAGFNAAAERRDSKGDIEQRNANREWEDATDSSNVDALANNRISGYDVESNRPDVITDSSIDTEDQAKTGISTTTPGDAGAGAIKGAGWGLGVGAVAALAALFVPGVGLVIGGGALAAALGAVAASTGAGAAAGAVAGYLKDQGVDDAVANEYQTTVTGGGAVVAVTVPSGRCSEAEAREVLNKYGATNINAFAPRANSASYVA